MKSLLRSAMISFDHRDSLGIDYNLHVRIVSADEGYERRVIRLHMVDNQIIYCSITNCLADFIKIFFLETGLYSINQSHLLIYNKI